MIKIPRTSEMARLVEALAAQKRLQNSAEKVYSPILIHCSKLCLLNNKKWLNTETANSSMNSSHPKIKKILTLLSYHKKYLSCHGKHIDILFM